MANVQTCCVLKLSCLAVMNDLNISSKQPSNQASEPGTSKTRFGIKQFCSLLRLCCHSVAQNPAAGASKPTHKHQVQPCHGFLPLHCHITCLLRSAAGFQLLLPICQLLPCQHFQLLHCLTVTAAVPNYVSDGPVSCLILTAQETLQQRQAVELLTQLQDREQTPTLAL